LFEESKSTGFAPASGVDGHSQTWGTGISPLISAVENRPYIVHQVG
jgi:hypothetical protein